MRISYLRKIYPYLTDAKKNIRWRNITDAELDFANKEHQLIANCYSESVRHSMCLTNKGREILKKRIKLEKGETQDPAYKISLSNEGVNEVYRTDRIDYYGKYWELVNEYSGGCLVMLNEDAKLARLSIAFDIAISKFVAKHPMAKPIMSRLYLFPLIKNRRCEHNLPSNAYRWFTGKEPNVIGEAEFSTNLKKHKAEVYDVFENFDSTKDSYVLLTGFNKLPDVDKWHCLPIVNVDKENKVVHLLNKRFNTKHCFSYDEIVNKFKGLVGMRFE